MSALIAYWGVEDAFCIAYGFLAICAVLSLLLAVTFAQDECMVSRHPLPSLSDCALYLIPPHPLVAITHDRVAGGRDGQVCAGWCVLFVVADDGISLGAEALMHPEQPPHGSIMAHAFHCSGDASTNRSTTEAPRVSRALRYG